MGEAATKAAFASLKATVDGAAQGGAALDSDAAETECKRIMAAAQDGCVNMSAREIVRRTMKATARSVKDYRAALADVSYEVAHLDGILSVLFGPASKPE